MSSEHRSSSAVRNLRSLFENKDTSSPDARGRSPNGIGSDKENADRRASKVRANFVSVTPMAGLGQNGAELKRESSAGLRRGSFSESDGMAELKKTVTDEQMRRERDSKVKETVPEAAVESASGTPVRLPVDGPVTADDSPLAGKMDKRPANPDKPVTAAEEEPSDLKLADPASADAVSGGEALTGGAEDLRHKQNSKAIGSPSKSAKKAGTKKPMTNGKPAAISTKPSTKPSATSAKSASSLPKTPTSSKPPSAKAESPKVAHKAPVKKPSRASLAAPTAASTSRTSQPPSNASPPSKSKPREPTKPADLPSHLTAPTASSRAKHDLAPPPPPPAANFRASTTTRPRQPVPALARPTPRSSLAASQRPQSRDSLPSSRRSVAPVDSSFLERMMRPTAASASKTHEKSEAKTPPKAKAAAPPKPKVNGHPKKPAPKPATDAGASAPAEIEEPGEEAVTQEETVLHDDEPAEELAEETQEAIAAPSVEQELPAATAPDVTEVLQETKADPVVEQPSVEEPAAVEEVSPTSASEPTATETQNNLHDANAAIAGKSEGPKVQDVTGLETPRAHVDGDVTKPEAALEATPTGLCADDTIR